MRHAIAAIAALSFAVPVQAQLRPIAREIFNALPADAKVEQFTLTADERRSYYTTPAGGLWLYDRETKATTRLTEAVVWDLSVSAAGDAIAYTKLGEVRREQFVWVLPLSPSTGLAAGVERRLSARPGDVPAISPDGKRVAFARDDSTGVGQSLVIVEMDGGAERVVAGAQPSGIRNVRWTPDGTTLFFGVNPPVPFVCAESCLALPREARPTLGSIRRVAASGGSVATVVATNSPFPGLSPDGTTLVFGDTSRPRGFIVADVTGRRLDTLTFPAGNTPQGWTGASRVLTLAAGNVRRLGTSPLVAGSGEPRVLFETADFSTEPSWSPDGKTAAFLRFGPDGCELWLTRLDGTSSRGIPLSKSGCGAPTWIPDQSAVVFTSFESGEQVWISRVALSTGKVTRLHRLPQGAEWSLDRDMIIVAEPVAAGPVRRTTLSRVSLDGKRTLLREVTLDSGTTVILVDRSRALLSQIAPREFRVLDLNTGAQTALFSVAQGFVAVRPSLSADRQWAAFRVNPTTRDAARMNRIDLVRLDGSARRSVEMPLFAESGLNNPAILPDANGVVVVERRRTGATLGIFLVDVAKNDTTRMANFAPVGRAEMALSPDGRTLLYLVPQTLPPKVSSVDVSLLRPR